MARPPARLGRDIVLDDRLAPANLTLTGLTTVDASNNLLPSPVFGQMLFTRANWSSSAMLGPEPGVPVRFTADFPANYFGPGTPARSFPLDSANVDTGIGNGTWSWWLGGWYCGTAAFTVTATVDPNNVIAETNETDNSLTITVTPVTPADLPSRFLQPIGTTPSNNWLITNYADVDPRSGTTLDYRGGTRTYDGHDAIDAGPGDFRSQDAGIPIYAAADGTVGAVDGGNNFDRETSWSGGQNWNAVTLDHGSGWQTVYGHLAAGSITVKAGDVVKAGQVIGLMGSSGISTATHLHYTAYYRGSPVEAGVSPNTYWVNPLPYAGDTAGFYYDAFVTTYDFLSAGDDGVEGPAVASRFGTADPSQTLFFYLRGYNLKANDVMYWRWIRPNGTVEATQGFSPGADYTYSNWFWSRPLSSFQGQTGTWQVVFYLNGVAQANEQRRVLFDVVPGTGAGVARLMDGSGGRLLDGRTTPVDFDAAAAGGAAPQLTFNLRNPGTAPLTVTNYVLPPGFTLVSGPSTVPAGSPQAITVRMDTAVVGTKFGTLRFDTNDPVAGTYELNLTGTVTGAPVAGAPALDLTADPATAFNRGSLPRLLAPNAGLTDGDSATFAGGTLTAEFASFGRPEDRLAVRNVGTGTGQIGVSGSTVTFAGTAIGTLAGGVGTTPLVVTLNASATVAATRALVQSLTYQNVSPLATTQRKAVRLTLVDDTGKVSNEAIRHVVNTGVGRNPAVAGLPGAVVLPAGDLTAGGSFTDPWGASWTGTVDYGDGSGPQPLTLNPDKTFALAKTYTPGAYTVAVTVSNEQGGTTTSTIAVTVPEIVLSGTTIGEFRPTGVIVGTLAVAPPGAYTFTLVAGAGSTDNGLFTITQNQLRTARPIEAGARTIRVRATPATGPVLEKAVTITVADNPAVALTNRTLGVTGTANADTFAFTAGPLDHLLVLNGVSLAVRSADADAVTFDGAGGSDSAALTVRGTGNTATLRPGGGTIAGPGYSASALAEFLAVYGGATDVATLTDTPGSDVFSSGPTFALIQGGGATAVANGFGSATAFASAGSDAAYIGDSAGNDVLVAAPTYALLQGTGFYRAVVGFDGVTAFASGGSDAAYLNDSAGDDVYSATPTYAFLAGAGFYNTAVGFDGVTGYASGGNDAAYLTGSAGADLFSGTPTYSYLTGGGVWNTAVGFDGVNAYGGGGADVAYLTDSAGDDAFSGAGAFGSLSGPGYFIGVDGFASLNLYGTNGGTNRRFVRTVGYTIAFNGTWV